MLAEEIEVAWMVGSGLLIMGLLTMYLCMGASAISKRAAVIGACLFCDDSSCPMCVKETAKLLKMRDLLVHTPLCAKRMSIGRVACDCGHKEEAA